MKNNIIILNQIADSVTLYANCYKNGYTKLHYFSSAADHTVIDLQEARITIRNLSEKEYCVYCTNENEEETGYISFSVATTDYGIFWNNLLAYEETEDSDQIVKIKEPDYVTELYKKMAKTTTGINGHEEFIRSCVTYYNMHQEILNAKNMPEFTIKDNRIESLHKQRYKFIAYWFDLENNVWKLVPDQTRENISSYQLYEKPLLLYRILVLDEFCLAREYFYYQPSKTLSEAILEGQISTNHILTEKTAEMMAQYDLTDIKDDEYGQEVVCALQEMTPDSILLPMPQLTYDENNALFYVDLPEGTVLPITDCNIYLAALEIEQAFAEKKAPHKTLMSGDLFVMNPTTCYMNREEDYIFYFCDKNGRVLSEPSLYGYHTETNTMLYRMISRKIDVEIYRRRLFNVFKEYDKQDWNIISTILDRYIALEENLYIPITQYMIQEISKLDIVHYNLEYLIQLVLLNQLRHYLPVDQNFISQQVYAEGYHKHVFPENQEPYIIRCARLNKNRLEWDYMTCENEVAEIRVDNDTILFMQAMDKTLQYVSPYAFYSNMYLGQTRYFYYPNLEVTVAHGLY